MFQTNSVQERLGGGPPFWTFITGKFIIFIMACIAIMIMLSTFVHCDVASPIGYQSPPLYPDTHVIQGHSRILQQTNRDHSMYAPSQWEMALQCNAISHWLVTYTEWSLMQYDLAHFTEHTLTMVFLYMIYNTLSNKSIKASTSLGKVTYITLLSHHFIIIFFIKVIM